MAKKNKIEDALENAEIPYLIGETAYIHEGDFRYLSALISGMVKKDSCDGIKFHIMVDIDSYMTPDHKLRNLISKFLLSKNEWITILKNVKSDNFDAIILVDDVKAIDFVKNNIDLVDAVELHACALNNIEMLENIKGIKVPIILGIGGSEIDDIEFSVKYLSRNDILLMHGFQNYPTKYEFINFRKMIKIKNRFNLPVGYADHTNWDNEFNEMITLAGFMAGANILEKHVALDLGEKRVDFESAISIDM